MDDNLEEGQQQQSSNRADDVYRNALRARPGFRKHPNLRQGAKVAGKLARKTGSRIARQVAVRTAIFLAANPEILIPLLIIGIILIVFIIILAPMNTQNVNAGTQACGDIGGTCIDPSTSCGAQIPAMAPDTSGATCNTVNGQQQICCVPPTTGSGGGDVVSWALQINSKLQILGCCPGSSPSWCGYTKLPVTFSNNGWNVKTWPGSLCGLGYGTYFCTYLARDANRLAGKWWPTGSWTCDQMRAIASHDAGYTLHHGTVLGARPGDALYWLETSASSCSPYGPVGHVDLIKDITLDSNGNGYLHTLDANSPVRGYKMTVIQYSAKWPSGNFYNFWLAQAP